MYIEQGKSPTSSGACAETDVPHVWTYHVILSLECHPILSVENIFSTDPTDRV